MIILKNITKRYEKAVFENFSLNIDEGITTAIMGKSGCGKTTLFNMLCKTSLPDSGEIKLPKNQKISVVFQENRLFTSFTGYENLAAVCSDNNKIKSVLNICEAEDFAQTKVKNMSGGMARRIAIARSLLPENRIILMDEPFKGIDTAMRDRILLKLKQYLCKKTCVIITHDTNEAANIAQKAVILGGSPANVVFECICNDIQKTKSLLDSEIIKL